ncbi:endonuclease/exonuclease/phosphatase family protein [Chengkuizengella axinellae]|uniref:Inositol polyphosphate-related phosphatase domain-containing protein n=1 Tax=Chengkuizengella axinellae TaxID=3064388 RepID=A0ABT9J4S9_9BACL|nr:hypothetical protein [Chengkuizengella sp. 2205SS18-9]MDP5276478.1 hypothetical protein [Chengkuizengella sp. 2205SS18-9]
MKKIYIILLCFILSSIIFFKPSTSIVKAQNVEGEFSLLTYNVAGLWDPVSSSNPATNTILISPKLNDYNIVLAQEDFNYHDDLIKKVNHPYLSSHSGTMGFGDGLSRMSNYPITDFKRVDWNDCNGIFDDANDCLTPKGFTFARHELSNGVYVDIYNLHADAGGSNDDKATRKKNFQQVLSKIEQWSDGNAVIVAGDFNSKYKDEGEVRQFTDAGFFDAWADIKNDGRIPDIGETGDRIDKIIYRSGDQLHLSVTDYAVPNSDFLDSDGKQLSDHKPVSALFNYKVSNIPLIGNFNAYKTIITTGETWDEQKVWKIQTKGEENFRQNVNYKVMENPKNSVYTFSVWLKADDEHTVTLRLRNKEKTEGGQQSFTITTDWKKYEITAPFEKNSESLSLYFYPAGYDFGSQGYVYASRVELKEKEQYLNSANDFTKDALNQWYTNTIVENTAEPGPIGGETTANIITPTKVNDSIYQHTEVDPEGKSYTFGIWLKADEPHQARIKIQNEDFSESENRVIEVTKDWQYFEVSMAFANSSDKVTVLLWPGDYNGSTDSVYAWGASLVEE